MGAIAALHAVEALELAGDLVAVGEGEEAVVGDDALLPRLPAQTGAVVVEGGLVVTARGGDEESEAKQESESMGSCHGRMLTAELLTGAAARSSP